ncbi:beta-1,3-glucanase family protein [Nocardiopsis lambiniae]|uniref:Beta-1,3-glucanase family protein n=1 Tax=Nocardiopsis lambiniae TaxID=3075539 RepID=A0ABU2M479_9ACTN|nr:beta-1,3-glucanase family protein [Nocardiopsis sp. DSM 44743]MDT0327116.1 beta-1,3-glucanase family protein [Nocardiopsis sp. DSM 44743]
MIDRRHFLGGISAAAGAPLLLGTLGCAPRASTADLSSSSATANPGALPVSVRNETGRFSDGEILAYVIGTDLTTGRYSRVDANGVPHPVSLDDNGDDGYADYGIPLPDLAGMTLPYMSGRIYLALGGRLHIRIVVDGDGAPAPQLPAGWVEGSPGFDVLHDTVEFTHNDAGMFCNTSMVDQFSVPIGIRLVGDADQTTGTFRPGGREAVFRALSADPVFSSLVYDDLRIISPGHGLDAGLFPADFYDPYIDRVWSHYAGTDLTVTTNAGTFTGRVQGDRFVFDGGVRAFDRPSTRDVFFCDGALNAPNDGIGGPVAAILGAALNRSTLLTSASQPTADPAGFYRDEVANRYAAVFHENTVDGRAYGFAFDDVADFASYIQDHGPQRLEVTLTAF